MSVLDYIDSLKFGGLSCTFLPEWMDIHSCMVEKTRLDGVI